jgi:hypothetical protein
VDVCLFFLEPQIQAMLATESDGGAGGSGERHVLLERGPGEFRRTW